MERANPEGAAVAERTEGVRAGRLFVVLFAALALIGGGAFLAMHCFAQMPRVPMAGDAVDDALEPPALARTTSDPSAPGALSLAEQRAVDNAIANGVWYLKDQVLSPGAFPEDMPEYNVKGVAGGLAALPGLALLECGVPPDDPVIQKTAAFVRKQAVRANLSTMVYQRSLAILFLDRLGDKKDEELIQYLALCLIAGQHPTEGGWSYTCPTFDRKRTKQLLKSLTEQSFETWRKSVIVKFKDGGWDNSNTQFAVLALWVAQRHGVSIAHSSEMVDKHFRSTQLSDRPDPMWKNVSLGGSWFYNQNNNSSGWPTMTCSGLLGLAVAHGVTSIKDQGKPVEDEAIKRALAMLAREIDRADETRLQDYYFLWSLERVGVLYNLPKIGGKDWYAWGRKELLAKQQPDGSWPGKTFWGSNPVTDTCFALLFLKQANLAKDLTSKLELLNVSGQTPPTNPTPSKKD